MPKIYDRNGLDAYRIVGSDGSEFFYEGEIEHVNDQVFKDEQGKMYLPLITNLRDGTKYYVEVEVEAPLIKTSGEEPEEEKNIASLILASPRNVDNYPEDITATAGRQITGEERPLQETKDVETEDNITHVQGFEKGPIPQEVPEIEERVPDAVVRPEESISENAPEKPPDYERPERSRGRMPSFMIVGFVAIIIIIVAISSAYILKPDMIKGYMSTGATTTPSATITATPVPTADPTVSPTEEPVSMSIYDTMMLLSSAIDGSDGSVKAYADNSISQDSTDSGNKLAAILDIYEKVCADWSMAEPGNQLPGHPAVTVKTMNGDMKDYSVLMCSLAKSLGFESRIVVSFTDEGQKFYPEIMVASDETTFDNVKNYLYSRYRIDRPYVHTGDSEYWINLEIDSPGAVINSSEEYAVYPEGYIVKLMTGS
ncbi:transglutaminase-like domain-containing protein [Methanooceanicella nereidis]|uniref:transglutaminase-like domain-containing protein n=1 Tax=Methanooceanicella nereidis TaxID=2052831 RepID=UPI001E434109